MSGLRNASASAAVGLVALCVCVALSLSIGTQNPLTRFDSSVLETLRRSRTPTGATLFLSITALGSLIALAALGCAGALLLAARREWIVFVGWTVAFSGAGLLDHGLKTAIQRPRPPSATALIELPASWSFPSGHAMSSLVCYGMLAYVLLRLGRSSRRSRAATVAGAVMLVLAIGFSRLYLGVHYFSDVVGGYAAGLVWLIVCIGGVESLGTPSSEFAR